MSMRISRPIILNHVLSPYGIAFLSTLVFLFGWCFPGDLYSELMNEPDLLFLDPRSLLFFLLCVAGFCVGLLTVDFLHPSPELLRSPVEPTRLDGTVLAFPLIVTTTATALVARKLLLNIPDLVTLLLAQQGGAIKSADLEPALGLIGWGAAVQTVVLWWTYWKLSNFQSHAAESSRRRWLPWLVFVIGIIAQTVVALLKISRSDLMPVFAGFAVLYLLKKIQAGELDTAGVVRRVVIFMVSVMLVFVAFALFRGADGPQVAFAEFVGYTLSSYNRLAALLGGTMHYPYGGRGAYIVPFSLSNNFISSTLPFKDSLGWPGYFDLWNSEFQGFQGSGLNSNLIWSGAFGYIFSDAGWGTPLILGGYGLVYGMVWQGAKCGTTMGVGLYPWLAFSALSWFSSNLAFDSRFPFLLLGALSLAAYEKLFSKRAVEFDR